MVISEDTFWKEQKQKQKELEIENTFVNKMSSLSRAFFEHRVSNKNRKVNIGSKLHPS
jgi:hypothetical protein